MTPRLNPIAHRMHAVPERRTALAVLIAPALLAGCMSLAPNYQAPALPVPQTLAGAPSVPPADPGSTAAPAPAAADGAVALTASDGPMPWRDFVQEARLRALIEQALASNRDLRVAVLAIERARAQYGVSRADLLPGVNGTAGGSRSRTADDLTTAGRSNIGSQYSAQLGFSSYEIDFWGRVRNLNEAALQEFLRAAENRRSVQLSLVAEVANAWLTLDADARRLQLARETLRTRQQSLDLTQRSYQLGATSGLTLAQTQTSVDSARVDVATFSAQVARDRNALQLLVGAPVPLDLLPDSAARPPDANSANSADSAGSAAGAAANSGNAAPTTAPGDAVRRSTGRNARADSPTLAPPAAATALLAVPQNLPSNVLLRRPDVQAAEHTLQGSYASIGAARAAFFPSITLTGSVGTASTALSGLFDGGNGTWSFAPQIRLPIFDAGRNRANLQVAEVAQQTAVAQYEKAIQTAFREVADALADRTTVAERLAAQRSLLDATQRSFDISEGRFRLGADSYLAVLDAQRSLYTAQQTLITLQLAEQANRITLYKVLGGHWADGAVDQADAARPAPRAPL